MHIKCSTWLFWLLSFLPLICTAQTSTALPELVYASSEHFVDIDSANLDGLLERIGDSRLVLLGEASHGTAEFYDMRARITRELIERKGFSIIAAEADWPDAESINHFILGTGRNLLHNGPDKNTPFSGFPAWMWANRSVAAFTDWLKDYNQSLDNAGDKVSFYGLDFYNMYSSIEALLDYLFDVDPAAAEIARRAYGCLMPWSDDPSLYGRVMRSGKYRDCGNEVSAVLQALYRKRALYIQQGRQQDRQRYFSAGQNARMIKNAELFYRTMYYDNDNSWNQRDRNMFETLQQILHYSGGKTKAIIWAHNSHIGDARATDMYERGDFNLGQQVRETFGDRAYLIGFGTDHGTVAAASRWGGAMEVMQVPTSHEGSYERLFHDVRAKNFLLPLRKRAMQNPAHAVTRNKLLPVRLQRAIGTTYDPQDELRKHYFPASLPRQFDEYIWFDETRAVVPLSEARLIQWLHE